MVWSYISQSDVENPVKINGIMNAKKDLQIFDPPCNTIWKTSHGEQLHSSECFFSISHFPVKL